MSKKILKSRHTQHIDCFSCTSRHLCITGTLSDKKEIEDVNSVIQHVVSLKKHEHLFHAHTPMKNLYAIHKGSCKEYWTDENGNECLTNFYFSGDLIALESIPDRTNLLSVSALEDTELCVIPLDDLYNVMQKHADVLKRFVTITGFKMRNDRSTKMGTTANERISDFLLNITSRMLERSQSKKNIPLSMSQLDISNFLGIAHETVSRIFKNLQSQNIIKIQNKMMTVLDLEELERLGRFDYSLKEVDAKEF